MRAIISTLATASAFALVASVASADCGGHSQVTASKASKQTVAMSTYGGPAPTTRTEAPKPTQVARGGVPGRRGGLHACNQIGLGAFRKSPSPSEKGAQIPRPALPFLLRSRQATLRVPPAHPSFAMNESA